MSFEESLKKLEEMSDKIREDNTTLDEAIECYKEGIKAYDECNSVLKEARQKIETVKK